MSFNNIRDADAAIRIIRDFKDRQPLCFKHMNPRESVKLMTSKLLGTMLMSLTQCLSLVDVVLNREVDAATAEKMHGVFLEIIIAPSYTDEALAILTNKEKNLRILAFAI